MRNGDYMGRKGFFVLCGIITLLLVSCGKNTVTDTSMNSNKTLNVAYQNSIAYAPILVAKEKGLSFIRLVITFFVLHLSYGWGSLVGILKLPFIKS